MEEQQIDKMREDLILEHKDIGIEINRHFSISATILCNEQTWEKEIVKGLSQLVSKSITMNHGLELKFVSHFWNRVSCLCLRSSRTVCRKVCMWHWCFTRTCQNLNFIIQIFWRVKHYCHIRIIILCNFSNPFILWQTFDPYRKQAIDFTLRINWLVSIWVET